MLKNTKIVIIGGVAAGATAAGKAARTNPDAHITIFEKGPYISYANCGLPYYISREVDDRGKLLVRRPEYFKKKYGIDVFVNTEVIAIKRHSKTVVAKDLTDNSIREVEYDKLILAMGAYTFMPPILGLDAKNVFTLRTIPDIDAIEEYIQKYSPSTVAVLGGGYIGVEACDVFRKRGMNTTLFEMMPQVLPPLDPEIAKYVEDRMLSIGINVIKGDPVDKIEVDTDGFARRIVTKGGKSAPADLIIASFGVRPNVQLARDANLEIGKFAIITNDYMQTSDPDIYAAGDVAESKNLVTNKPTWSPLAGPANLQGKVAGCNAAGGKMRYRGVLRTSIVQFDGLAAAKTGLSEKEAMEEGLDYISVTIHSSSHAEYFPGAKPIHLKGIFHKGTGRLLGAQVVGEDGADKRIDILATALMCKMTAEDLENLDLAYSPQFSHAIDAVNILGAIGREKLESGG